MASQKKFERSEIEIARQRLLEAIYSELPDDRFRKRDAVKQLLSTLIAARERGLPFDKIAEILKESGVDLPTETLRSYFFELKTQSELAAESIRHAQKIALTRDSIQKQVREKHTEHGNAVATRRARLTQATPPLTDAFGDELQQQSESVDPAPALRNTMPTNNKISDRVNTRPASPAAPVLPPAAEKPVRIESDGAGPGTAVDIQTASPLPTSEIAFRAAPDVQSRGAMTLADIEQASLATEERTELLGDVELRAGDLVYYTSGQPFHGLLSRAQIRALRTLGRVFAPTKGRTSKDFVSMPIKL